MPRFCHHLMATLTDRDSGAIIAHVQGSLVSLLGRQVGFLLQIVG